MPSYTVLYGCTVSAVLVVVFDPPGPTLIFTAHFGTGGALAAVPGMDDAVVVGWGEWIALILIEPEIGKQNAHCLPPHPPMP